ncbi:MAG: cytochrome c3 family protein [Melioribacteraceae bacterium]|jgi:predicted CXXCH cytochrome family protein|nr:cytochrome c3 family protein [Melioribacteraceae bacterium]
MNKKYLYEICSILIIFSAISIFGVQSDATNNSSKYVDECIKCHMENEMMPEHFSQTDVHWQKGLSCAGCHGGLSNEPDEEKSMSKSNGFVGVPNKKEIPEFCGKCHSDISKMQLYQPRITTDQVSQYYVSKHGKQLKVGDLNVATCTDCHTTHEILPASDTRSTVYPINVPNTCNACHGDSKLMEKYNMKANQVEEYSQSVHGIALLKNLDVGAPACNDCHGNHGAIPPGVESISHVCGSCHVNNMNYFNNSVMAQPFSDNGINSCEQCHDYHLIEKPNDEMLNVHESSTCTDCHSSSDEGYLSSEFMYNKIKDLSFLYDSTKVISEEVHIMGMNNIEIEYSLKKIKQSLIQSRTIIHTFDTAQVFAKADEGILASTNALILADNEIEEYFNRRLGYGITTFIFILLAAALYWKIKGLKS